MSEHNDRYSIQEQRRLGYLPEKRQTFVAPDVQRPARIEALPAHEVQMHVEHAARQEVIVHTSAQDRARGFQLIITPISLVVALLAVLVSIIFDNQFFSFFSLLIFWLVFALIYVAGWALTALATPEAVSFYSAKRQWDVIEREQKERWEHYRWQTGRLETRQDAPGPPMAKRKPNEHLDSLLDAWWFPWALLALLVYFAVGLAWLIVRFA